MRLLAFSSVAAVSAVTPMQKVIEMLQEMQVKGRKALADEKKLYEEIKATVYQRKIELNIEIEQNTEKVAKYKAGKENGESTAAKLDDEVAAHKANKKSVEADLKAKTEKRASDKAEASKQMSDFLESENALERAIQVMSAQDKSIPVELVQKVANDIPVARSTIEEFLQQNQPQASEEVYGFQGGGIVDLLKKLLKSFKTQIQDAKTGEMNAANSHNMLAIDLQHEIELLETQITEKTSLSGEALAKAGQFRKKMEESQSALDAASSALNQTIHYEEEQDKSYAENTKTREEELGALSKAEEIMSGDAVTTAEDKHGPEAKKGEEATSFLQVSSKFMSPHQQQSALLQKAGDIIKNVNNDQLQNKSQSLALVMAQMLTGGTFDKIIGMVRDMIKKLEEEAAAENTHKVWCDGELDKTAKAKKKYEAEVARVASQIANNHAELETNKATIATLTEDIDNARDAKTKAEAERAEEKALNLQTIDEAKAAVAACEKAIAVLQKFYDRQAASAELIQEDPKIEAYKGQSGSSGGVIGLIETIMDDYTKLSADTAMNEEVAVQDFTKFMETNNESMETNTHNKNQLETRNVDLDLSVSRYTKKKGKMDNQLQMIMEYWGALQPMCVVQHVSYEERVAKRKEEIQALKDAYAVLSEEAGGGVA